MRPVLWFMVVRYMTACDPPSTSKDTGPTDLVSGDTAADTSDSISLCESTEFSTCVEINVGCTEGFPLDTVGKVCGSRGDTLGVVVGVGSEEDFSGAGVLGFSSPNMDTDSILGVDTTDRTLTATGALVSSDACCLGWAMSWDADIDDDGIRDLLIGYWNENTNPGLGAITIFSGPIVGDVRIEDAFSIWSGADNYNSAGQSVVAVPGSDEGDGFFAGTGGIYGSYAAYVADAMTSGNLSEADLFITHAEGSNEYFQLGHTVATADLDNDGISDLLTTDVGGSAGLGVVLIASSDLRGTVVVADLAWIDPGMEFLYVNLTDINTGDMNCDGYQDILIPLDSVESEQKLMLGPLIDGGVLTDAGATIGLYGEPLQTGWSESNARLVPAPDDPNCGGQVLLAASASVYPSSIYAFTGPFSGTVDQTQARVAVGPDRTFWSPPEIEIGADLDEDGNADVYVGAPRDDENGEDAGAVYRFPAGFSTWGD